MIFQDPLSYLNPRMRIGAQIGEAVVLHQPGADVAACVADALERVGLPSDGAFQRRFPHELSGGMRQRVLIAIALACQPKLLIADEPTTALDVTLQAQIVELLRRLSDDLGMALLLITHDMGVVAELCDRVYVMYAGQTVEQAPCLPLFEAPRHPYTSALLDSTLSIDEVRASAQHSRNGSGSGRSRARLPLPRALRARLRGLCRRSAQPAAFRRRRGPLLASHDFGQRCRRGRMIRGDVLLRARGLTKHFQPSKRLFTRAAETVRAVENVSIDIRPGRTLAVVGESGSGKSTTGRLILRLIEPTAGELIFDGRDLLALDPRDRRLRRDLQVIFQDPRSSLNPRRTIYQTLRDPLLLHGLNNPSDREVGRQRRDRTRGPDPGAPLPRSSARAVQRRPAAAHRYRTRDLAEA